MTSDNDFQIFLECYGLKVGRNNIKLLQIDNYSYNDKYLIFYCYTEGYNYKRSNISDDSYNSILKLTTKEIVDGVVCSLVYDCIEATDNDIKSCCRKKKIEQIYE